MNELAICLNQFLASIPKPLSKLLNNKFNSVLHVFWCVVLMENTVTILYKDIVKDRSREEKKRVITIYSIVFIIYYKGNNYPIHTKQLFRIILPINYQGTD